MHQYSMEIVPIARGSQQSAACPQSACPAAWSERDPWWIDTFLVSAPTAHRRSLSPPPSGRPRSDESTPTQARCLGRRGRPLSPRFALPPSVTRVEPLYRMYYGGGAPPPHPRLTLFSPSPRFTGTSVFTVTRPPHPPPPFCAARPGRAALRVLLPVTDGGQTRWSSGRCLRPLLRCRRHRGNLRGHRQRWEAVVWDDGGE